MSHLDGQRSHIEAELISTDDLIWIAETAPNAPLDEAGNLPLHYAAAHGEIGAILSLLELGADARLENNAGSKASEVARDLGHIGAAIALRKAEGGAGNERGAPKNKPSPTLKNSGEFLPTYKTNLLEEEADWSVPGDIPEELIEVSNASSIPKKRRALLNVLDEIRVSADDGLVCFYERIDDIFKNMGIVISEFKEINSEILSIQEGAADALNGFGYITYNIEKIIEQSSDSKYAIDKISEFCKENWDYEDFLRQNIEDHTSVILERINFSNFVISVFETFTSVVEGDLLNNFESGDQDLFNPKIKLVPPLYEGLRDLERSSDCFEKEWAEILKSKSFWDGTHWTLPETE